MKRLKTKKMCCLFLEKVRQHYTLISNIFPIYLAPNLKKSYRLSRFFQLEFEHENLYRHSIVRSWPDFPSCFSDFAQINDGTDVHISAENIRWLLDLFEFFAPWPSNCRAVGA